MAQRLKMWMLSRNIFHSLIVDQNKSILSSALSSQLSSQSQFPRVATVVQQYVSVGHSSSRHSSMRLHQQTQADPNHHHPHFLPLRHIQECKEAVVLPRISASSWPGMRRCCFASRAALSAPWANNHSNTATGTTPCTAAIRTLSPWFNWSPVAFGPCQVDVIMDFSGSTLAARLRTHCILSMLPTWQHTKSHERSKYSQYSPIFEELRRA